MSHIDPTCIITVVNGDVKIGDDAPRSPAASTVHITELLGHGTHEASRFAMRVYRALNEALAQNSAVERGFRIHDAAVHAAELPVSDHKRDQRTDPRVEE